jgi:hypothetical protein
MSFLIDLLSAVVVGLMFIGLGDILLGRSSRKVAAFFESLAVGAAVSAAMLFPLSLLAGSRALDLMYFLLAMALFSAVALWGLRAGRSKRDHESSLAGFDRVDGVSSIFLILILIATGCFAYLNWRVAYSWDGFQIWASRAQMIFIDGQLDRERFPETLHIRDKILYPPLIPLFEALVARVQGGFDFDRFKPIFLIFFSGLLVLTYSAVRAHASRRVAVATTALVALLPELSAGTAAGGYADMPLAFFVSALLAAISSEKWRTEGRTAIPWLTGGLCFVKSEGLVLTAIAVGSVGLYWVLTRSDVSLRSRITQNYASVVIVSALVLLRIAYIRWIDYHDISFMSINEGNVPFALSRLPAVLALSSRYVFDVREWGLFWPSFFVGFVILMWRGTPLARTIAIAVLSAFAAIHGMFLFTNWEVALHIDQALSRLLAQIAPAAAIVLALAYNTARSEGGGGRNSGASRARDRQSNRSRSVESVETLSAAVIHRVNPIQR